MTDPLKLRSLNQLDSQILRDHEFLALNLGNHLGDEMGILLITVTPKWKIIKNIKFSRHFIEKCIFSQNPSNSAFLRVWSDSTWKLSFSEERGLSESLILGNHLGDEMGILLKNSQTNGNTMKITNFCYYLMWYCWQLSFYNGLTTTFSKKVSTIK